MADRRLVVRTKDYFTRQIAWFERMLADIETLEQDLEDLELQKLSEQQARHTEGTAGLEREFGELTREWETATGIAQEDREAIHKLAQRAEVLAMQLCASHESAQQMTDRRIDALKDAWNALRRGRGFLQKYRLPESPEGNFIDRKA